MCFLMGGSLIAFIYPSVSQKLVVWGRSCSPCTLVSYLKWSKVICHQCMHMLYLSYKTDNSLMEQDATKTMERCINDKRIWMLTNKLKLNKDKTEFMVIGTRPQLGKVSTGELTVGYSRVAPVSTAKNLGVWLDPPLKLDTHTTKMCSAAYYHLHNIWRIWEYITHESTPILVHAVVIGQIDGCNSLLHGLRVQNVVAISIPTVRVIVT